jgi:hypothetical protein
MYCVDLAYKYHLYNARAPGSFWQPRVEKKKRNVSNEHYKSEYQQDLAE